MIFSYKTRRILRRLAVFVLAALLMAALAMMLHLVWLQRFVVYTPQGVKLNLNSANHGPTGKIPVQPEVLQVPLIYLQADAPMPEQPAEKPILGYYITTQMLKDLDTLRQQIAKLPAGTAILMDVKSYWGYFYYSSAWGPGSDSYILTEVDAFIAELTQSELYVIARLPALRDYDYACNNTGSALQNKKGYPWPDENQCYWLDPTDDSVLTYLIHVTKELRNRGFDEVVFKDFYIPESNKIVFQADRKQSVEAAAQTLVSSCATDSFTVSFVGYVPDLVLPDGNCRLYLMDVAAADIQDVLTQVLVADKRMNVVFIAQTNDTRYNVSGVLRPLELAH